MRDPRLALFGAVLLVAGVAVGFKANLASQARDQFDAQHKPTATIPSEEEDRGALDTHMQLGHTAQIWWIIASVIAGAGLLATLTGLLGTSTTRKPPV